MEAFINKMRKLKGIRKLILIAEAWKAIASANMADYIKSVSYTHLGKQSLVLPERLETVAVARRFHGIADLVLHVPGGVVPVSYTHLTDFTASCPVSFTRCRAAMASGCCSHLAVDWAVKLIRPLAVSALSCQNLVGTKFLFSK